MESSTSSSVKRVAEATLTGCWAGAFGLAGRVRASAVRRWHAPGGQRILVVAPHADDEACGCAGTLVLHRQSCDEVRVVCVTDGSGSRALGLGPREMVARRRREAESAAALLGARLDWLGLPEGTWDPAALQQGLLPCLVGWRPDVIYAPSRIDFHPDHVRVAAELARVLEAAALDPPPVIRVYQVQVPLTPELTNLISPIGSVADAAAAALRLYQSQLGSVLRVERMKRYAAAWHRLAGPVEPFWELPVPAYGRVHREVPREAAVSAFRGVRARSLTDPLAYWVGWDERRRLRRLAGGMG